MISLWCMPWRPSISSEYSTTNSWSLVSALLPSKWASNLRGEFWPGSTTSLSSLPDQVYAKGKGSWILNWAVCAHRENLEPHAIFEKTILIYRYKTMKSMRCWETGTHELRRMRKDMSTWALSIRSLRKMHKNMTCWGAHCRIETLKAFLRTWAREHNTFFRIFITSISPLLSKRESAVLARISLTPRSC